MKIGNIVKETQTNTTKKITFKDGKKKKTKQKQKRKTEKEKK